MKKKILLVILSVLIIEGLAACSTAEKDVVGTTETTVTTTVTAESTTENTTEKETTTSEPTTNKSDDSDITIRPAEQKSKGQTTAKKEIATQKQTTTQKVTTTQKTSTTKKETTTATTKQNELTKSDVEWVQSQANSYIKSKGCTLNSNVDSFSGRISSKPYTNKSELLEKVKDSIDYEYQHCIDSGWDSVDMFCKAESRSDGSYFIYVMYG